MSSGGLKVGSYHPTHKWSPLDLILIRSRLDVGIIRLENAIRQMEETCQEIDESQRKNTEELIETLRHAMISLQDIEGERNIANHNSLQEKIAHSKTMSALQDAEVKIQKLKQEGEHLRDSLAKFMRNQ